MSSRRRNVDPNAPAEPLKAEPPPKRQNSTRKALTSLQGDDEFSIMSAPEHRKAAKGPVSLELDKDVQEPGEEAPPEGFFWRVLAKFK